MSRSKLLPFSELCHCSDNILRIREIGTGKVVFATDWLTWPPTPDQVTRIALNAKLIRMALPLDPGELKAIFANANAIVLSNKQKGGGYDLK